MIKQAYLAPSVKDFPFLERLNLQPYTDPEAPALFIGCYTIEDFNLIVSHKGKGMVLWVGQDSIACVTMGWHLWLKNFLHVTWLVNAEKILRQFLNVKLVNPMFIGGEFYSSPLGNKIFAYAPSSYPDYHRIELINELALHYQGKYEFIIGDGTVSQAGWLNGVGDKVYDECFIGLCLSGFAGGGQTIIQMGLKGRRVVSNVLNCQNSYFWETLDDVKRAIDYEAGNIGHTNEILSKIVRIQVMKSPTWINLEQ